MKKRNLIAGMVIFTSAILIVLVIRFGIHIYKEEQIKNAKILIELVDDKKVPFNKKVKVSDFIESINGKLVKNKKIDTTKLGKKTIKFEYINEENLKVPYSFQIEIIDNTPPDVWLGSSYNITTDFSSTLEEKIICIDDLDDEPNCKIEGDYDTKTVGKYNLKYIAVDASNNKAEIPFILNVNKPKKPSSSSYTPQKYKFVDAKNDLGGENTKFGIDVSSWQGDIDFDKLKNSGVEFAFVRIGSKWGMDGEYFLDSKFERNMEGFNRVKIPVGIYFYSYARNDKEAKEEALWVIENLKKYKVDLPIAFDFEDWSKLNKYKISKYRLNQNAKIFIDTVEKAGYKGMIYSSLNYINKIWNIENELVWVAHYTKNANYKGKYDFWQFSASGKVDGIYGDVDMDIMYEVEN